jgi:solute:Na+ symporter, SSS family
MNLWSILSFLAFTGLVAFITWRVTRRDDRASSSGYFLAGRSLTFPLIAGSLLLTNLSTEQMVGLNGLAFGHGLSVMVWEVQAVVALVVMGLFFLPKFLRSGISTVPEFLERRFDSATRTIANAIFLSAYALILLPIILYTGATGMISILGLDEALGLDYGTTLWLIVIVVALIGAVYAISGGLRSVAVSDTLNGIGLLLGGLLIVWLGLRAIGGEDGGALAGWTALRESRPESLNSIGGPESAVPFGTLFTGVLIINLFYWCTNQQIIQRTFAAKSLAEGQKGVLLTGGLKLLGPLYLVLPGIIAFHIFAGEEMHSDLAYGKLVNLVLPPAFAGIFAAVLLGAILSSFNSALNATCTLFSLGFYKTTLRPEADDAEVIRAGHRFGWVVTLFAVVVAPLLAQTGAIFGYLQDMNAMYFIPIFSVVLLGLLHRRLPPIAAKFGLLGGVSIIAIGYFVEPFATWTTAMNRFHFVGAVFAFLIVVMLALAAWRPRAEPWVLVEDNPIDLTPWKHAKLAGALLVLAVFTIYAAFADFSVLQ